MGVLISKLFNLMVFPVGLLTLCCVVPVLYFFKAISNVVSALYPENMANKVVLITGSSSGFGEHIAYEYARRGARLALVARRENALREIANRCMEIGSPDALVIRADVANEDECKQAVEATITHFGRMDHLMMNAGVGTNCLFEEIVDVTRFQQVMDVNFWGSVYPAFYAIPHLRKTKGRIVVTASSAGWGFFPRLSFYSASKAATLHFFETLRIELAPDIGVTIVSPGGIQSEMTQGKFLNDQGDMELDQDKRDMMIGPFPQAEAKACAQSIVKSACRRARHVVYPPWFRFLFPYRVLAPEVMQWLFGKLVITTPGVPPTESLNKRLVDATGTKKIFYPASLKSTQLKE